MPTHLREQIEKDYIINIDLSTNRYPLYRVFLHDDYLKGPLKLSVKILSLKVTYAISDAH